jgi:hypothetical protein
MKTAMQELISDLDKIKKNLTNKTEIQTIQIIIDTTKNKYLEMEKEQIINAVEWGNRKGYDEHTLTCIYDDDLKYYKETYTQSSE